MPNKTLTVEQVLPQLAATPRRLAELSAGLDPALLRTPPAPGAWSANELLAHLRACADVWGECMRSIVTEDRPTLRAINPLTWITRTDYPALEFRPSLRAFAAQRAALLSVLDALPPPDWTRTAMVTGAGAPLERTVLFYGRWLAGHERQHLRQVEAIVTTLTDGAAARSRLTRTDRPEGS